jgi:ERCC4-type nuclease
MGEATSPSKSKQPRARKAKDSVVAGKSVAVAGTTVQNISGRKRKEYRPKALVGDVVAPTIDTPLMIMHTSNSDVVSAVPLAIGNGSEEIVAGSNKKQKTYTVEVDRSADQAETAQQSRPTQ